MAAQIRQNEARPGVRALVEHLITSDDRRIPEHLRYPITFPDHPGHQHFMATVRDSAIFRLWARAKVVYAMDDLLLHYLSQSSASAIPTQILRNLPHANPYVLLPKPDLTDKDTAYYRRHIGVPWGAFVFGRYNDAQQLCSTRDERREDLGLMFVGILDTAGGPVLQFLRCTIPLRTSTVTVEGVVDATVAKFTASRRSPDASEPVTPTAGKPGQMPRSQHVVWPHSAKDFPPLIVRGHIPDISFHVVTSGAVQRLCKADGSASQRPAETRSQGLILALWHPNIASIFTPCQEPWGRTVSGRRHNTVLARPRDVRRAGPGGGVVGQVPLEVR